jgi:hypothetical protein
MTELPQPSVAERRGERAQKLHFRLLRNWYGLVGIALFSASIVSFLFLLFVELFRGHPSPYLGLIHYMVIPGTGTLGLVLMGVGWWVNRRRRLRGEPLGSGLFAFDLDRPGVQQKVLLTAGAVTSFSVFLMAFGGYRSFEFSESVTFCGEVCHAVIVMSVRVRAGTYAQS